MFRRSKPTDKIETIIGADTSFAGDLKAEGGVRVEGAVSGTLHAKGNVIVGKQARVTANISGSDVLVSGQVKGNIEAQGQLAILAGAQVWGDALVGSLLVEEGGMFSGKSTLRDAAPPVDVGAR